MASQQPHVFISYVREDADRVDGLCALLERAGIPYWRDRDKLGPGDEWKAVIREAIRSDSLVFLGCFSEHSRARTRSHMNEELRLAIEEFRLRSPGQTWIIPVRFDDDRLPEWELDATRQLSALNYVDLFGDAYAAEAVALVTKINSLLDRPAPDASSVQASVAQTEGEDRALRLRALTKEMLPDPSRRIALADLVSQEAHGILDAFGDEARFPTASWPSAHKARNDVYLYFVEQVNQIWSLTRPLCESLQVAVSWAEPAQLAPWTAALRDLAVRAESWRGGVVILNNLRRLPLLVSVMTIALTAVRTGRWDNAKALLTDLAVDASSGTGASLSLLEVTNPWAPFPTDDDGFVQILARATQLGEDPAASRDAWIQKKAQKLYTPVAEWLYVVLRPVFAWEYADEETYERDFDRAEMMLGLLSQDRVHQKRALAPEGARFFGHSNWFGRSTWRAWRYYYPSGPLARIESEVALEPTDWPPLRAGLFGKDPARLREALQVYSERFNAIAAERT